MIVMNVLWNIDCFANELSLIDRKKQKKLNKEYNSLCVLASHYRKENCPEKEKNLIFGFPSQLIKCMNSN